MECLPCNDDNTRFNDFCQKIWTRTPILHSVRSDHSKIFVSDGANFNRKPKNYGSDQSIKMSLPLPEWQVEYKWLRILDWLSLFIINVNVYMNIITKHITAKYKNYFQFLDEHISRKVFFMILYLRYRSWNIEIFNLRRFHYLGPSNHKFKTDSFSRNNGDTVKRFD